MGGAGKELAMFLSFTVVTVAPNSLPVIAYNFNNHLFFINKYFAPNILLSQWSVNVGHQVVCVRTRLASRFKHLKGSMR